MMTVENGILRLVRRKQDWRLLAGLSSRLGHDP